MANKTAETPRYSESADVPESHPTAPGSCIAYGTIALVIIAVLAVGLAVWGGVR